MQYFYIKYTHNPKGWTYMVTEAQYIHLNAYA